MPTCPASQASGRARLRAVGWAALWLVLLTLGAARPGRAEDLPEYRLKAAFLYNFAAFTEWPAEVGGRLVLCTYATDPFAAELDVLHGKSVGARVIEVQRKTTLEPLKGCQIVFIAAPAMAQLPRVLDTLRGLPVLVIADSPGAIRQGVTLNMVVVQDRVAFEVNLIAARGARLTLSSKLLRLATEVVK